MSAIFLFSDVIQESLYLYEITFLKSAFHFLPIQEISIKKKEENYYLLYSMVKC